MTLQIRDERAIWLKWIATGLGAVAILGEAFIAFATLLSGYLFGFYDVIGVALGILALVFVWKRPVWACLFWLAEEVMLYNGHLLVSVAFLPMLLLPASAAILSIWSWYQSRLRSKG